MTRPITMMPIGVVSGGRSEIFEDHWGPVISRLVLDPAVVDPDATLGLGEFSHIEVVFCFHREARVRRGAAHPPRQPGLAQGRGARGPLTNPAQPPRRLPLRTAECRRSRADRARPGRHRRHPHPRHQALRDRIPAIRPGPGTSLDARAYGRLLLSATMPAPVQLAGAARNEHLGAEVGYHAASHPPV
jgi:hypothetical protein